MIDISFNLSLIVYNQNKICLFTWLTVMINSQYGKVKTTLQIAHNSPIWESFTKGVLHLINPLESFIIEKSPSKHVLQTFWFNEYIIPSEKYSFDRLKKWKCPFSYEILQCASLSYYTLCKIGAENNLLCHMTQHHHSLLASLSNCALRRIGAENNMLCHMTQSSSFACVP